MKFSDTNDKIAPALVKALAKITDVGKSETATVPTKTGGKYTYKYATLGEVMTLIRPIFAENAMAILQFVRGHEGGTRVEIETMALHESGQWASDTLTIPADGGGAQGFGSAITYGRRYGVQAFVGMASIDDDAAASLAAEASTEARMWESQLVDWVSAIEVADTKEEAKKHYNDAVAKAKERTDVGAANRVKRALLKRFPVEENAKVPA